MKRMQEVAMMKEYREETGKNILTNKDFTKVAFRSGILSGTYNYQTMMGAGFGAAIAPELKKIYGEDEEGLREALVDNSNILNTQVHAGSFLLGLVLSLEEKHAPREMIAGVRNALFGPLAGIGDSIIWYTVIPLAAGVFGSMAKQGSVLGPMLYFLTWVLLYILRIPIVTAGYRAGIAAVSKLNEKMEAFAKAASILGITVVGGLIASYISISLLPEIKLSADATISLQTDLFDAIFPNILSAGFAFLIYWLLKKGFKPTSLILGTSVVAVVLSYLGIV